MSGKTDPLAIEVFSRTRDDGDREVVVRDNSGGVKADELEMLFGLGKSAKDEIVGSVGAYGVGMKKAILRLADEATVATRHKDADTGYGFSVDREWLDEGGWERPVEQFDLPSGVTEVRLRRLNFNPSTKFDDLKETLSTTYEIFLGGGPRPDVEDYDFEIVVDGEALDHGEPVNWSFPPFDGLYPRQYRDIELDSREVDGQIKLHLTVGLLQKSDMETSGTDVYVQKRKVHDAVKDEQGGFNINRYLGEWKDSAHKRLKVIMELETDGDARDLPWNSSKSSLDLDSQIAKQAFNWLGRVAQPYYRANFQSVPQTLLRPYGRGEPHAMESKARLGEKAYDFSGRTKVTSKFKPKGGYPAAKRIARTAEAHARLGIKYPESVNEEYVPAYEEHVEDQFNRNYSDLFNELSELENEPTSLDIDDVEDDVERIDGMARRDASARRYYIGLDEWEVPRYEAKMREFLGDEVELDDLETIEERPDDEPGLPADEGDLDDEGEVESDEDRDRFDIALTQEQTALFNRVLGLPDGFENASPGERADALASRLERLEAVLEVAGGMESFGESAEAAD